MAAGKYDHPAFLVPQQHHIRTTAGASSVEYWTPPYAVRITELICNVKVAGTADAAAAGGVTISQDGTAKGTVSLSTHAAGDAGTAASLGITVPANGTVSLTSGTDATAVQDCYIGYFIDPGATWNIPS